MHPLARRVERRQQGARRTWAFFVAASLNRVARYYDEVLQGRWAVLDRSVAAGQVRWLAGRGRQRVRIEATRQQDGQVHVVVQVYLAEALPRPGVGSRHSTEGVGRQDAGANAARPASRPRRPSRSETQAAVSVAEESRGLPKGLRLPKGWRRIARVGAFEYRHPSRDTKTLARQLEKAFERGGWKVEGNDLKTGRTPIVFLLSRGRRMVVVRLDSSRQGTLLQVLPAVGPQ